MRGDWDLAAAAARDRVTMGLAAAAASEGVTTGAPTEAAAAVAARAVAAAAGARAARAAWQPHWSINGTVNGPFTNHLPLIRVTKPVTHYGRINSHVLVSAAVNAPVNLYLS